MFLFKVLIKVVSNDDLPTRLSRAQRKIKKDVTRLTSALQGCTDTNCGSVWSNLVPHRRLALILWEYFHKENHQGLWMVSTYYSELSPCMVNISELPIRYPTKQLIAQYRVMTVRYYDDNVAFYKSDILFPYSILFLFSLRPHSRFSSAICTRHFRVILHHEWLDNILYSNNLLVCW